MALPLFDTVRDQRDAAMVQVASHAEQRAPGFSEEAEAFVLQYLCEHGPTAGELVTLACKASGIRPHDDRAFGPVYMRLARQGRIVKAGTCTRQRGHGTAGGNIWALR